MTLPIRSPYPPMEALLVEEVPAGRWLYEPKWDGFRCLAFRDGKKLELQSKSGQPLARYFPEIVDALRALRASRFVLDGELVIPEGKALSFDALLQRIHPAESRVRALSRETPAAYVVFDLLVSPDGRSIVGKPLKERRRLLEKFCGDFLPAGSGIVLSPSTGEIRQARKWLSMAGGGLDGIVAKDPDQGYRSGERGGMQKVKVIRTVDCVVGGFRYASGKKVVGSLLLGLYDAEGKLHHVGFTSGISAAQRKELTKKLEALIAPPGFTGRAPGGPSRWATQRSAEWKPLAPKLVVEVRYDSFAGGRFRHGTGFLRWRPDKSPRQCTLGQVETGRRAIPIAFPPLLAGRA